MNVAPWYAVLPRARKLSADIQTNLLQRHRGVYTGIRSMATLTDIPLDHEASHNSPSSSPESSLRPLTMAVEPDAPSQYQVQSRPLIPTTVHSFPEFEPLRFAYYPSSHLDVPLRKDLLHRAVIYEGDKTRQGTASTKWRYEVHGSKRKLAPQKGQGRARVGDKKSPIRRGGGVAFGPKPRDFATSLPRKVYDQAWRIALSFRWRKGELVVVDRIRDPDRPAPYFLRDTFERNGWGKAHGRSLIVPIQRTNSDYQWLAENMGSVGDVGKLKTHEDVDVKDLLSLGRVIIEYAALNWILRKHSRDLAGASSTRVPIVHAPQTFLGA
ncbi:MAG: 54S ribosomal protein, mitochondrial [Alyxoria varia]|nr:MAG: 54S ribosomal protein, mitochondrial [Alyxoria varia]